MCLKLKGKRALVTGSTAGVGATTGTGLAREGARVIVTGRSSGGVEKAVRDLKAESGGDIRFSGDLGTAAGAEALVRRYPDVCSSPARASSEYFRTAVACGGNDI